MKSARSIPFDKILQVRAPEALTDALDVAASRRLVNRSDYIRVALLDRLKADGIDLAAEKNLMTPAEYVRCSVIGRLRGDGIDPSGLVVRSERAGL